MISRSQGRSATAAIAYRVAERIDDRRTGLTFDYAARGGVDHTETLAPEHAPDWVFDRSELWNRVEEAETRKNSQVAREVRVALPAELTHAQRVELVRDFAQEQFVDRGMIADIALHAPGRDGDDRNHHAHILLTTREIGPEGFTTKNRDWNKVEVLEGWREAWARDSNIALERAGIEDRVDHRTLEAQRDEALELASAARERGDEGAELVQTVRAVELDRPPLPQLSPGAWQMKERGIEVGRVGAWHEAADRVLDRLGPEQSELALAGGREGRDQEPDLATRLREAWDARKEGREQHEAETSEREAPDDLASRLRAAAAGIDREAFSDRVSTLREGREADEQHVAQEQERQRTKELEQEQEREVHARRDRGHDYGL